MQINGHPSARLPNILNVSFEGVDGESLLMALDMCDVYVSTGSACASGASAPSHVLTALGLAPACLSGSLRFSLGRTTTAGEVDAALAILIDQVRRLRGLAPLDR